MDDMSIDSGRRRSNSQSSINERSSEKEPRYAILDVDNVKISHKLTSGDKLLNYI